ncbi:hypothetical protein SAMN05421504_112200 [Amycolatopsis xylanica]|uniref:TadE-like protein n=1 Tax=Amycolatopsis xylanica TaxID=589385 RepID=A0A1H3S370_9PSEU|nr:hypothetical protein [Amycolatopsis xylanica]SDZ32456.1 hypothetical protein SAMN05421504_112200 [Amycolatopsis xylanica]
MNRLAALHGERGDENLTAAYAFSALLFIAWAVFQAVAVFLGSNVALEAARDGVNAARLPPVDTAAAETRARDYTSRVTLGWLTNVAARASSDGRNVTVTVSADAASFVPFLRFPVSQTASAPIEQLTS